MASTAAQSVPVASGGSPGLWMTFIVPAFFMLFGFPYRNDSGAFDRQFSRHDEQYRGVDAAKRNDPFLSIFEAVIDPRLAIRVFECRYAVFQGNAMLAAVFGIVSRIPIILHAPSYGCAVPASIHC